MTNQNTQGSPSPRQIADALLRALSEDFNALDDGSVSAYRYGTHVTIAEVGGTITLRVTVHGPNGFDVSLTPVAAAQAERMAALVSENESLSRTLATELRTRGAFRARAESAEAIAAEQLQRAEAAEATVRQLDLDLVLRVLEDVDGSTSDAERVEAIESVRAASKGGAA